MLHIVLVYYRFTFYSESAFSLNTPFPRFLSITYRATPVRRTVQNKKMMVVDCSEHTIFSDLVLCIYKMLLPCSHLHHV